MLINSIALNSFRVFSDILMNFDSGINVITGANAEGKTSLLEAVFYVSCNRSFRTVSDKELIKIGSDSAFVIGEVKSHDRAYKLETRFFRNKRREVYINGVKQKKPDSRLSVVLFNPGDLDMIKDGAAVRRRLMDLCISQLRPRYHTALQEFNRLYEHKTRILRDFREKPALLELLDDFNLRLAVCSAQLIYYRYAFSQALASKAAEIHSEFTGGSEKLSIKYKTVGGLDPSLKKPSELLPLLLEHQESHKTAELRSGLCLSGAHKDELEISINNLSARKFASQGQARTAAVSIKLAERDIHYDDSGEYPVLLLDDVLSELDTNRQGFLLDRIPYGQVLITCCDEAQTENRTKSTIFRIQNGRIV